MEKTTKATKITKTNKSTKKVDKNNRKNSANPKPQTLPKPAKSTKPTKPAKEIIHATLGVTAVKLDQFPVNDRLEVAFVGKSNVGKSSMINTMLGRKSLVRTSQTPGKTRTINFFEVEQAWYFVDLPGYGYAKVSKSESQKWAGMVESYLKNRPQLLTLVLLLDIRHEPTANDKMLYEWCKHYNLPVILVATKSDKLKRSQIDKYIAVIRKSLAATEKILPFSSLNRAGREELWEILEGLRF
ncbi:MAG: ribosome biogenesis GTP-binding protein YihA/YsxC [Defluviitaleaceae bacterium]|nr:ribosome biogenesis GTP-binding protein YihA/YsxC [Defluviitaleaceae bacterium]